MLFRKIGTEAVAVFSAAVLKVVVNLSISLVNPSVFKVFKALCTGSGKSVARIVSLLKAPVKLLSFAPILKSC